MVKDKSGTAYINGREIKDNGEEMSFPEKMLMFTVTGPQPRLPYPLRKLETAWGKPEMEYVIPDGEKQEVLKRLYLFDGCPAFDAVMYDLHEQKMFNVRDFRVIRWNGANLLASPYFPNSGGMLVDWAEPSEQESTTIVNVITRRKDDGK